MIEKIKELCKQTDITFHKLEKICGLSNGSISKWDKYKPNADTIVKLANFFNVSTDFILGRSAAAETALMQEWSPKSQVPADITAMWQQLTKQQQGEIRGEMKGYIKTNSKNIVAEAFSEGETVGRQRQKQKANTKAEVTK